MMQRYFVDFDKNQTNVKITGDDFHHIKNVMRMKVGTPIYLANNHEVFYAVITAITPNEVICELQYEVKANQELPISITLAQGIPKLDKFEWIIQKTTELGVNEIIPVQSERTIVKLDPDKEEKKLARYRKIAKEASEQSHRVRVPEVRQAMSLKELISFSRVYDYKLVAYEASEEHEKHYLATVLDQIQKQQKLLVFIGPEGGISNSELDLLKQNGFQVIGLGERILRTETAPIFFMSSVVYHFEVRG